MSLAKDFTQRLCLWVIPFGYDLRTKLWTCLQNFELSWSFWTFCFGVHAWLCNASLGGMTKMLVERDLLVTDGFNRKGQSETDLCISKNWYINSNTRAKFRFAPPKTWYLFYLCCWRTIPVMGDHCHSGYGFLCIFFYDELFWVRQRLPAGGCYIRGSIYWENPCFLDPRCANLATLTVHQEDPKESTSVTCRTPLYRRGQCCEECTGQTGTQLAPRWSVIQNLRWCAIMLTPRHPDTHTESSDRLRAWALVCE